MCFGYHGPVRFCAAHGGVWSYALRGPAVIDEEEEHGLLTLIHSRIEPGLLMGSLLGAAFGAMQLVLL